MTAIGVNHNEPSIIVGEDAGTIVYQVPPEKIEVFFVFGRLDRQSKVLATLSRTVITKDFAFLEFFTSWFIANHLLYSVLCSVLCSVKVSELRSDSSRSVGSRHYEDFTVSHTTRPGDL